MNFKYVSAANINKFIRISSLRNDLNGHILKNIIRTVLYGKFKNLCLSMELIRALVKFQRFLT